ncbi:MAG TPA: ribulose-phosphate 3-epimerase [bacterium]|nr:ribulose-phosphate 3-epimerase [bacterium]HPN43125.1 ribulose-phosphate 3-epimerase [bacterium]
MVKIAPSVLSADFSQLKNQINLVEKAGADWIHLDVMDGHYVPNITFGPLIIEGIRNLTQLPLDAHLMIENADRYIKDFVSAGVNNLTVHYEACPHLWNVIEKIHELGIQAGVTLNPATPVTLLEPVLNMVDLVLVMTVEPGFGGQKFIPEMVKKINWLYQYKLNNNLNYHIEVDGGIDAETTPLVVEAGANVLVAGNAIFNTKDIETAVYTLRDVANKAIAIRNKGK